MRENKYTGLPLVLIGSLFLLTLLPFSVFSQDNFTAEEIAYQEMFDQMIESDIPDTTKFKFFVDSLRNIKYYSSKLPFTYAQKGIAMAEKANHAFWKGRLKAMLGLFYVNTSIWDSSIIHLKSALIDFEKADDTRGRTHCHGLLRYAYVMSKDYEKSLEHCYKKLEIHKEKNQEFGIGTTYNDLAGTYLATNNYKEALANAIKGKEILMKYKNIFEQVRVTEKIARSHKALGNQEEALNFFNEAIEIGNSKKPKVTNEVLSELYTNRSSLFLEMQQYDNALKDIETARYLFKKKENKAYLAQLNYKEAAVLFQQKKYRPAKKLFLSVLAEEDSEYTLGLHNTIYQELSKTYAGLGEYDSAYFYQLEYEKISLKEKGHESKLKMEELKAKYETEQKEATIVAQNERLSQQRIIQWFAIGFAALFGLLLLQSFRSSKSKKSYNQALETSNALLAEKNKENEILLKEIHHRVKNNLQTISSLLSLQSESIEDKTALDAVKASKNRVASIALIHEKLYQRKNMAAVEMRDYFETIGHAIIESFGPKADHVELEIKVPPLELDVDTAIPIGLITNELITNSLKYAFKKRENGKISIHLEKGENNLIQLIISDNGEFDDSSTTKKEGTGFGTLLVELLTTQLGGQLEKYTDDGTATKILFKVPNSTAA